MVSGCFITGKGSFVFLIPDLVLPSAELNAKRGWSQKFRGTARGAKGRFFWLLVAFTNRLNTISNRKASRLKGPPTPYWTIGLQPLSLASLDWLDTIGYQGGADFYQERFPSYVRDTTYAKDVWDTNKWLYKQDEHPRMNVGGWASNG